MHSRDAVNLSLAVGDVALPAGARLRLYDGDGLLWHGPYAPAELTRHARFFTPVVPGERLLLELSVPASQQDQTRLAVQRVHHGYRDLRAKSGSCNIDTACPAADSWTDAVRATARITIGGRRLCSAVLLNNTRENGDPLLLTARHCGIGQDSEYPASSVVVYWNYETSRCSGDPNGSLSQNQSGSTLLADGPSADFTLLRLDVTPPPHYQVYYAGWDATGQAPSSGVSVHHPSGDEKRISLFGGGLNANADVFEGLPGDADALRLDVLANDGGQQPLRLIDATAGHGQVRIEDGHLVYRFAPGALEDTLSYQVLNRWGETGTVTVHVRRGLDLTGTRGGALAPWLLLMLLGAWRCRRR